MAWWGVIGFFKSGPVRVSIAALMGVSYNGFCKDVSAFARVLRVII